MAYFREVFMKVVPLDITSTRKYIHHKVRLATMVSFKEFLNVVVYKVAHARRGDRTLPILQIRLETIETRRSKKYFNALPFHPQADRDL